MHKSFATALAACAILAAPRPSHSQQQAGTPSAVTVDAAVGTAIAERALTGAGETFKADVGKLYCFSKISNATDSDVEHVWYKGDAEVGRVKLHVGGSPWRTHSYKTLGENPVGDWRCDVVQNGNVLQSVKFKVEQ